MRLEDKLLERRDIVEHEKAEVLEQAQTSAQGEAHEDGGYADAMHAGELARTELFAMMRNIFDGNTVATPTQLPLNYQNAVELLAAAVRGKHPSDHSFVYAEDRRTMLEQSLAALQPVLAMGSLTTKDVHAAWLHDEFSRIIHDVHDLRLELAKLEATQEEYEPVVVGRKGKDGDGDEDDVDATDEDDQDANQTADQDADQVAAASDDNVRSAASTAVTPGSGSTPQRGSKPDANALPRSPRLDPPAGIGPATRKPGKL